MSTIAASSRSAWTFPLSRPNPAAAETREGVPPPMSFSLAVVVIVLGFVGGLGFLGAYLSRRSLDFWRQARRDKLRKPA
jgi:hypothetical protein